MAQSGRKKVSKTRNEKATKKFLGKALNAKRNDIPYVITVDKNSAYLAAIKELKNEATLPKDIPIRQVIHLNNIVEQDHRRVKRQSHHAMGYFSYKTVYNTMRSIETMPIIFKGQQYHIFDRTPQSYKNFIHHQFGLVGEF